jgi:hypothetical protein
MKQATIIDSPAKSDTRPEYDAGPKSICGPNLEATNARGRRTSTVPGTKIVNRSVRNQSIHVFFLPPNDSAVPKERSPADTLFSTLFIAGARCAACCRGHAATG